jgi:hypothetical protein
VLDPQESIRIRKATVGGSLTQREIVEEGMAKPSQGESQ